MNPENHQPLLLLLFYGYLYTISEKCYKGLCFSHKRTRETRHEAQEVKHL